MSVKAKIQEAIEELREAAVKRCLECEGPMPPDLHKQRRCCSEECTTKRNNKTRRGIERLDSNRKTRNDGKFTDEMAERIWEQRWGKEEREYYAR